MKKKKIAILGANTPLLPFYKQAKRLGYEIHSFSYEPDGVCKEYADYYYPFSFAEKENVLKECKRIGINGITSFSLESALPTVNYIAREMQLEGNPLESMEWTLNKFRMTERLRECGIKVPDYVCIDSERDLLGQKFTFPQIVKPVDSSGSRGVTKVNNQEELIIAYRRALTFSKSKKAVIGQFIEGRELEVDAISHHGRHYILSIADKATTNEPYFVELEDHHPANFSEGDANKIKSITKQVLSALGIYSSASFTELRMDNEGELYVIEIGARAPGDMVASHLVRLSTGYDFVKGILELATGDFTIPVIGKIKYSGIYFLSRESMKVNHFILNSARYLEIVQKEIYSNNIISVKESGDRAGYFIYQSDEKFDIYKYK